MTAYHMSKVVTNNHACRCSADFDDLLSKVWMYTPLGDMALKRGCNLVGVGEGGRGRGGTPGELLPAEAASAPAAPGTPGSWFPRSSPSVGSRSHPPQGTQSCPCQKGLTASLSAPLPPGLQLSDYAVNPNCLICCWATQ